MSSNLSIMTSGGADSFIAWHYAKKMGFRPQAIFVDLGQPYFEKELNAIRKNNIPVDIISAKEIFPLIEKRLSNQIIPSRNLLLAVIGSMLNPTVWINALLGEENGKENDKSHKFFSDTSNLLTFTNSFFQGQTTVTSPFFHLTKADTFKWALENGITKEQLFDTSTCYDGKLLKCGRCLSCVKRAMAFLLNDIIEPGYENIPFQSDYFKELLVEIPKAKWNNDYSRFNRERIEEFEMVIRKLGLRNE